MYRDVTREKRASRRPARQLSLLQDWSDLRSPKLRGDDRRGVYTWSKFYSAFAEGFAIEAITRLAFPGATILDPFLGCGTTAIAAQKLGYRVVGLDLDPFSCMLARAAVATRAKPSTVRKLLEGSEESLRSTSANADALFRDSDVAYAKEVYRRVARTVGGAPQTVSRRILADERGKYDCEALAIAALGVGAIEAAKVVDGSNPVWFREAEEGEVGRRPRLPTVTKQAAEIMMDDLRRSSLEMPRRTVRIVNGDFRLWNGRGNSVDVVVTSPPYLNRLDYVVQHLAALTLYGELLPLDLDGLRKQMIGTTKMVAKVDRAATWGPVCQSALRAIAEHTSKASATYYYWIYHQYFSDMEMVFRNLKRVCRRGARGAMVVQNTYYKEIEIDVPGILSEFAWRAGVEAQTVRWELVRSHMGTFSPRQLRGKALAEAVLLLSFE